MMLFETYYKSKLKVFTKLILKNGDSEKSQVKLS